MEIEKMNENDILKLIENKKDTKVTIPITNTTTTIKQRIYMTMR